MTDHSGISLANDGQGSDSIDLTKVWLTVKRKAGWLFLILLLTNLAAYLYLRYTRPVYESHSVLKLNIKSEANILGLNAVSQNLDDLAGEIELLKSNLFFSKVVDAAQMDVSYYVYGRVLFQERYSNSPFRVEYTIKDPSFYDRPIDLEIINQDQYVLSYAVGQEVVTRAYRFGEEVDTPAYRFVVSLTEHYEPGRDDIAYYFTINSDRALVSYLGRNMTVEPVNFNAKTIRIGFEGYNQKKVRDLVHLIDSVYLEYTQEKKNQATQQKIAFLDNQLANIEDRLSTYEDYFENFTIDNKTNDLPAAIGETIVPTQRTGYAQATVARHPGSGGGDHRPGTAGEAHLRRTGRFYRVSRRDRGVRRATEPTAKRTGLAAGFVQGRFSRPYA